MQFPGIHYRIHVWTFRQIIQALVCGRLSVNNVRRVKQKISSYTHNWYEMSGWSWDVGALMACDFASLSHFYIVFMN